ncbi:MAG: cupin domain-containing protein [Candidatus Bathyarchaeia archaeon]
MWKIVDSATFGFKPYPQGVASIKRILEQKTVGSRRLAGLGLLELPPGGLFPEHTHPEREEAYYVLSGSGTILVEGREVEAREGLALYVSGETPHGLRNEGREPLRVLYVTAYL